MKFLLFNLAVIAALVFLFNPDKADFHALADRAYETVGIARDKAESVVAKVAPTQEAKPIAEPAPPPEAPVAAPAPKNHEPKLVAKKTVAKAVVAAPPAAKVSVAPKVEPKLEPKLDPAVAQRRAEVLGLDAPAAGPAEEKLMSSEQRRRELFSLAEEMELFYVRRLSR